ncbi:MAG: hypothetical protein CL398_02745 [Acidiferrobacteraceae bacterium]|nr:hypothetical protein [Acidiferrobacteraceae bacterium]|tara:strand:- start:164 stop:946 length:783 start_codon:yes stop_codon:yes gene_type:complete
MFDPEQVAQLLLQARRPGHMLASIPSNIAPSTTLEAYQAQECLVSALSRDWGTAVGYKIGCTNQTAREMLAVESPFSGRCLADEIYRSPITIKHDELHMVGVEPEIAIRVGIDMTDDRKWTAHAAAESAESIMPAIEIVESRFSTWPHMGILAAIADNGVHRKLVVGDNIKGWSVKMIEEAQVSLIVSGKTERKGTAKNIDGGPFGVLAWLANQLNSRGQKLCAGDIVTTGVMTDIFDAKANEHIVADYKMLGTVEITVD